MPFEVNSKHRDNPAGPNNVDLPFVITGFSDHPDFFAGWDRYGYALNLNALYADSGFVELKSLSREHRYSFRLEEKNRRGPIALRFYSGEASTLPRTACGEKPPSERR